MGIRETIRRQRIPCTCHVCEVVRSCLMDWAAGCCRRAPRRVRQRAICPGQAARRRITPPNIPPTEAISRHASKLLAAAACTATHAPSTPSWLPRTHRTRSGDRLDLGPRGPPYAVRSWHPRGEILNRAATMAWRSARTTARFIRVEADGPDLHPFSTTSPAPPPRPSSSWQTQECLAGDRDVLGGLAESVQ